jgi:hypothetical protein
MENLFDELKPREIPKISHEERNAAILRRTLCAISGLYAIFNGGLGGLTWAQGWVPRWMAGLGALLALSAVLLWKPRRGAVLVTWIAAAGEIAFVVFDLRRHSPQAATVDGVYVLVAVMLLLKSRPAA